MPKFDKCNKDKIILKGLISQLQAVQDWAPEALGKISLGADKDLFCAVSRELWIGFQKKELRIF